MSVNNLTQYLLTGVCKGFSDAIVPITSFTYAVFPAEGCSLNAVVRVPVCQTTASSQDFSYATGYATDGSSITGLPITLNNFKYQRISLNDSEYAQINPDSLIAVGQTAGEKLANDVVSAVISGVVNGSNYPTTSSFACNQFSSSNAWVSMSKAADDNKWSKERSVIGNTSFKYYTLLNQNLVANTYGNADPVQNANVSSLYGFTPYTTTIMGSNPQAFFVSKNAIAFANGVIAPQNNIPYSSYKVITDEKSGLTFSYKEWGDPKYGITYRVIDCLFGYAKNDATGLIHVL
jgi:hypothetical protein